jgi:nucleoside-triphosphatase THEP1
MINIVSGIRDSGKTTFMRQHAKGSGGDGILSLKHFERDLHHGYDLLHLKSGRRFPFIREPNNAPADWQNNAETGPWFFSPSAFRFAGEMLLDNKSEPLYLDEIGPLEILGRSGFYNIVTELILGRRELFFSVRESLLEAFVETFSLTRSQISIIHLSVNRGKHD